MPYTGSTHEIYIILLSIAYGLKSREMKVKFLSRLYDHVFVTYTFLIFNEDTMSVWVDIISAFTFSSHIVKQVRGYCSHCISYPPTDFRQSGSQW